MLDPDTAAGLDPADPAVVARVQAEVDEANSAAVARRADQALPAAGDEWLPGGDELTPTMKLKRRAIAAKYEAEVEALYAGS